MNPEHVCVHSKRKHGPRLMLGTLCRFSHPFGAGMRRNTSAALRALAAATTAFALLGSAAAQSGLLSTPVGDRAAADAPPFGAPDEASAPEAAMTPMAAASASPSGPISTENTTLTVDCFSPFCAVVTFAPSGPNSPAPLTARITFANNTDNPPTASHPACLAANASQIDTTTAEAVPFLVENDSEELVFETIHPAYVYDAEQESVEFHMCGLRIDVPPTSCTVLSVQTGNKLGVSDSAHESAACSAAQAQAVGSMAEAGSAPVDGVRSIVAMSAALAALALALV